MIEGGIKMSKKKVSFPTAFTVLFIVLLFAALLTYIIPAGSYSKLKYNGSQNVFVITKPDESVTELPGTQDTLDQLQIKVDLQKFKEGGINKAIAIPGTYEKVAQNPQGITNIIQAPIKGVYDTIDIIMFLFIIGGCIGVLNSSGAFDAGIVSLSVITKGKEFLLIIVVTVLISIGGTTFGLAEETIALYPILVPVFMAAGYDAIVCIAALYMGSCIGTMFSTVNPFASVIASNAAGIAFTQGLAMRTTGLVIATIITIMYILSYGKKIKKDPTQSLIYSQKEEIEERFLKNYKNKEVPEFTVRRKLMLIIFASAFVIMTWGVSTQEWWFTEMTTLFLVIGILLGIVSGIGEKEFVTKFIAGSADLVSVALVVGVARSINLIMENGMISDSILNFASGTVQGMSSTLFVIAMYLLFIILGFFIPSSSGLAVLSMPIIAPLADTVGLHRDIIVSAYQYGQGLISFITPTGLILATLAMVDVTYDRWLKFIMPLMGYITIFAAIMLLIQALL
jgi:uncharacterized ion transporter superfamily protein YfcC